MSEKKRHPEVPADYTADGIAAWLDALPLEVTTRMRVFARMRAAFIEVERWSSGGVRIAYEQDEWIYFRDTKLAAAAMAKKCTEVHAVVDEAKRRNPREELLRDLLGQARALVIESAPTERLFCDLFDDVLSSLDTQYPHLPRRRDRGHRPPDVCVAEFRERMRKVGM